MKNKFNIVLERINKSHNRNLFDCGKSGLNNYLKKYARQNDKLSIGRTIVAVLYNTKDIVAYYTLSSSSVESKSLPDTLTGKLPNYPVPCVLLARLAIDERYQGEGLGEYLLMDAFNRILSVSDQIDIYAVIVNAKDRNAVNFFTKYGFDEFSDENQHMVISLKAIKKALL